MNKKVFTWQNYAQDYDFDFADGYYRKIHGESWASLADGNVNKSTMIVLMEDYCRDCGKDFNVLKKSRVGVESDIKFVDQGRAKALYKAHWSIKDIAIDCHCTEECVKEIIDGITK